VIADARFPQHIRSATDARHFLQRTLDAWNVGHLIESAGLLVSELVVNATLHARSACILRIALDERLLRVEVEDTCHVLPVQQELSLTSPNGRGLIIVDALADCWGVTPETTGKTVWFELNRD
jgi:hypothetical protein